jgi:coenzyme PQQ precursor peptide PqqA
VAVRLELIQHARRTPDATGLIKSQIWVLAKEFDWQTSILIAGARLKKRESQMAWKAPKVIEVSVGMEINMYMCAIRK